MKNVFKRKFRDVEYPNNTNAVLIVISVAILTIIVKFILITFIDVHIANAILKGVLIILASLTTILYFITEPRDKSTKRYIS